MIRLRKINPLWKRILQMSNTNLIQRVFTSSSKGHSSNENSNLEGDESSGESDLSPKEGLSFFEGGHGFEHLERKVRKDPLNIKSVHVPWVDDWFRTRQGFARINLIAEMTKLSPDQVQSKMITMIKRQLPYNGLERLSKILAVAPGLQEIIPLLHPRIFSTIISNISYTFSVMTMFKAELPSIDLGILASGYPPVLTWKRKVIYDCLCFLVVHFKGRKGAADALNQHPARLKYLRQLLPVLFVDREAERRNMYKNKTPFIGRLYQFNKKRKETNPPPKARLFYFDKEPVLRE